MNSYERVMNALSGEPVDRPPVLAVLGASGGTLTGSPRLPRALLLRNFWQNDLQQNILNQQTADNPDGSQLIGQSFCCQSFCQPMTLLR
jgi:hypothetical protein